MILVTGGAGFIGSHVVDALIAEGQGVRVLDALLPTAHGAIPDYLNPAADFVRGDLTHPGTVEAALRDVKAVCHQASMVGLGEGIGDVADYAWNNDLGTAVLLVQLARAGYRGRLVLASSMVVYGEGHYECAAHGSVRAPARHPVDLSAGRFEPVCPQCATPLQPRPIAEAAPLDPRNAYAATKVHQEHLCFAFGRETGVPVTALRYHNVYGPRMPRGTSYAGVAAIFASALAAGKSPLVFEDGGQLRDFVHVRDVARANVMALTRDSPLDGAFNVASGQPRSVLELAGALCATSGTGRPQPQVTGEFRLGDVRHVFASPEKAHRELGFTAIEGFASGMAEFAKAHLRAVA